MATLVMSCSSFEFFSVTVNGFANSLSKLKVVPWDKVGTYYRFSFPSLRFVLAFSVTSPAG